MNDEAKSTTIGEQMDTVIEQLETIIEILKAKGGEE